MGKDINKGMVFDVKKYATDDGPGIRTTIFLKGCAMRCWWCHNPEGQLSKPELMYKQRRCTLCGECIGTCRRRAISLASDRVLLDRRLCNTCGECTKKCPTDALTIVGKELTLEEVAREIQKDMVFYSESRGGITVSGGEPLFQHDFLNILLKGCKENGLHTALDTSGYAPTSVLDKVSDEVDLFLYDVKIADSRTHKKYTGASNKLILGNLSRLAKKGNKIVIRLPLIPGINDSERNLTKTAEIALSNGIENLSILPYHKGGIEKYKSLGKPYKLSATQTPSAQQLDSIREKLQRLGLKVKVGGG